MLWNYIEAKIQNIFDSSQDYDESESFDIIVKVKVFGNGDEKV